MEENRTRRALDELADLFLTGPTGGPPSPAPADAGTPDAAATPSDEQDEPDGEAPPPALDASTDDHPTEADDQPSIGHAGFDTLAEFDLEGPAPIRLPPKTRPSVRPSPSLSESPSPRCSIAEPQSHLRLHRGDEADAAEPTDARDGSLDSRLPESAQAKVEAVLLGNLPGLSGPWLTQYAQRLAQREGPVLLLHLDEQGLDMELVEPTDRPQPPGRVPPGGQARDLVDRLETLVRLTPNPVRRVLVHVEATPKPMVLARLRSLDAWTLLTGADDAATVAGYRLLKRMIETDPAATPRRVGVMMMGSDDDTACRGIARLRSAASSFLDSPIELVGAQRQMVPVNLRQLGRFEPMQTLWPSLRRWLAGLDPAEPQPTDAPRASAKADAMTKTAPPIDAPVERVEPANPWDELADEANAAAAAATEAESVQRDRPAPATAPPTTAQPMATRPANKPVQPTTAEQSTEQQPAEPATAPASDAPALAAFLTRDQLAGGVALEARCPHQPDTELLLDQHGRLHLLRRHQAAHGLATRTNDDLPALRNALVELLEARAWVREHVNLLQLTQRQCQFDQKADPVLHLFTHRADLATALTARLGPMLKLHLLQKVGQGDHATWFSTPLN